MSDPYSPWPKGEAFQTPAEPLASPSICRHCGSRHNGPLPWCSTDGSEGVEDDAGEE